MGRITGRYFDVTTNRVHWSIKSNSTNDGLVATLQDAIDKLAHYEDLEEAGRLIELPCAVGDTVWQITRNFISEFKIKSFVCDNEGIFFYWECISGIYINILGFSNNRIGKDVFLTKEEAEAKLKELEGE